VLCGLQHTVVCNLTHVSLNDDAVEGLRCLDLPVYSVQIPSRSPPGLTNASYLFHRFTHLMARTKRNGSMKNRVRLHFKQNHTIGLPIGMGNGV